jgi:putative lipoic acid-binding regulatory protein
MDFPCIFNLKVIGAMNANLESIIMPAMVKNNIEAEKVRISSKASKGGKYTSFTVTFAAQNQEQLDNIYREISGHPDVIIVL